MKLIFCMQISMKVLQIDNMIFDGDGQAFPKFPISLQYLKKEARDDVDFLHADKH